MFPADLGNQHWEAFEPQALAAVGILEPQALAAVGILEPQALAAVGALLTAGASQLLTAASACGSSGILFLIAQSLRSGLCPCLFLLWAHASCAWYHRGGHGAFASD